TYLCSYAARRREELSSSLVGVAKPLALLAAAAALLLCEPDFGAACVLLATGFAVLFIAGMQWRYVAAFGGSAIAIFTALAVFSPYRLRRIVGFLDPWEDPFGSGFQLTQS